jgi:hypothetical protein
VCLEEMALPPAEPLGGGLTMKAMCEESID